MRGKININPGCLCWIQFFHFGKKKIEKFY